MSSFLRQALFSFFSDTGNFVVKRIPDLSPRSHTHNLCHTEQATLVSTPCICPTIQQGKEESLPRKLSTLNGINLSLWGEGLGTRKLAPPAFSTCRNSWKKKRLIPEWDTEEETAPERREQKWEASWDCSSFTDPGQDSRILSPALCSEKRGSIDVKVGREQHSGSSPLTPSSFRRFILCSLRPPPCIRRC